MDDQASCTRRASNVQTVGIFAIVTKPAQAINHFTFKCYVQNLQNCIIHKPYYFNLYYQIFIFLVLLILKLRCCRIMMSRVFDVNIY